MMLLSCITPLAMADAISPNINSAPFSFTGGFDISAGFGPNMTITFSGPSFSAQAFGVDGNTGFGGPAPGTTSALLFAGSTNGLDDFGLYGAFGALYGVSGAVAASLSFTTTKAYPYCPGACVVDAPGSFSGSVTAYVYNQNVPYEVGAELWSVEVSGKGVAQIYYGVYADYPSATITITEGAGVPTAPEPGSLDLLAVVATGFAIMALRRRLQSRRLFTPQSNYGVYFRGA
jgi:hypothetical protein